MKFALSLKEEKNLKEKLNLMVPPCGHAEQFCST